MIKGIIFDMDGVLVLGANKFHVEAWEKTFQEHNINLEMINVDEYGKLEGMKGEEILEFILKKNNLSLEQNLKADIYKRKKEIFKEIDDPFTPDEIKQLVHDLHNQGYKLAVASGNNRVVIDAFLTKQNLHDVFEYTITGDEVARGKPDPEVFLKALEKIGLTKDETIIIENAPLGVQAAKASGMFTVAVTSTVSKDLLSEADKIIDNLNELPEVLNSL